MSCRRPAAALFALCAFVFLPAMARAEGTGSGDDLSRFRDEMRAEMGRMKEEMQQVRAENADLRHMLRGRSSPPGVVPVSVDRALDGSLPASYNGEPGSSFPGKGIPAGPRSENGFNWDFGGQWRVMANAANFGFHSSTIGDQKDDGFLNERLRNWLWVSPAEGVEGYMQVEIGHITFGRDFEFPKSVQIELRRGYLTYRNEDVGDFRLGIQDWHDMFYAEGSSIPKEPAVDDYRSFGSVLANSIWDFNVGGLTYHKQFHSMGDLEVRLGGYVLFRDDDGFRAADTQLWAADLDLPVCEDAGIGWSFYWVHDSESYSYPTLAEPRRADDLWTGLRGHAKLGGVPVNGFFIFNQGWRDDAPPLDDFEHTGWAAKAEVGPLELGPGKFFLQTLFATGEDDPTDTDSGEFRTIAQSAQDNFGAQGYWSYLFLTSPHGPSDVNDLGVGLQNRGLGLYTVQGKYAYPIVGILSGTLGAGWLRSFADNSVNGHAAMGVEIGNDFHLDLGRGFSVDFGAAGLFTGDFYEEAGSDPPDPDNLYEVFLRTQLEF